MTHNILVKVSFLSVPEFIRMGTLRLKADWLYSALKSH